MKNILSKLQAFLKTRTGKATAASAVLLLSFAVVAGALAIGWNNSAKTAADTTTSTSEKTQKKASREETKTPTAEKQAAQEEAAAQANAEQAAQAAAAEQAVAEQVAAASGRAASGSSAGGSPGGNVPAPAPAPTTITVTLSVDSSAAGNEVSLGGRSITLPVGASVYDALQQSGLSVSAKSGPMGTYVSAIGGLAEKAYEGNSGWIYYVNGSSPGKSCASYTLQNGDSVRWQYKL